MNKKTEAFDFGLVLSSLPVLEHNFTEKPLDVPGDGKSEGDDDEGREDREESEERSHEGYSEEGELEFDYHVGIDS